MTMLGRLDRGSRVIMSGDGAWRWSVDGFSGVVIV